MHGTDREKRRDRRALGAGLAIGHDQDRGAEASRALGVLSQPLASGPQASRSFSNRKRGVEIAARERCAHRADRLQP